MSDPLRLAELERQRALVASHLQWLDAQIARERARGTEPGPPAAPASPAEPVERVHAWAPGASPAALPPSATEAQVVPLHEPDPLPSKWGCWLTFLAVMLGLGAALALFIGYRYGGPS